MGLLKKFTKELDSKIFSTGKRIKTV